MPPHSFSFFKNRPTWSYGFFSLADETPLFYLRPAGSLRAKMILVYTHSTISFTVTFDPTRFFPLSFLSPKVLFFQFFLYGPLTNDIRITFFDGDLCLFPFEPFLL